MSKYSGGAKMTMTIDERRQKADEILREVRDVMFRAECHSALVIWISPFGILEHRVGYFPDYSDCEDYAKLLKKQYAGSGMTYSIYVDLGVE